MSSALMTGLLAFGFGAVCMLLGFFLIVRGIGASDSESTIKLVGIEIRTSRVGPGVLFSLFGLVLTIIAIQKLPSYPAGGPSSSAPPASGAAAAPSSSAAASAAPAAANSATPVAVTSSQPAPTADEANLQADPAQSVGARRQHEADMVRSALTQIAGGACPSELMEQLVVISCNQQLPVMQANLLQVGPIQSVNFVGAQQTPYGLVDAFAVQHANGLVVWKTIIGGDGKLQRFWYGAP